MTDIINMSVETMTKVSWLLFVVSGIFAVSAVILFFAFNIPRCLRMVSGKQKRSKAKKASTGKRNRLAVFDGSEETLPLGRQGCVSAEETLLLKHEENMQTDVLCAGNMDIIQDIVYMQDTGDVRA